MNFFMFFKDGGLLITIPILVLLLIIIVLWVRAFRMKEYNTKCIAQITSISWFAIAWAYFGRTIGLIEAFDAIAAAGDIAPSLVAGGAKMALIGPLFGLFTFLVARLGIIILNFKMPKNN